MGSYVAALNPLFSITMDTYTYKIKYIIFVVLRNI